MLGQGSLAVMLVFLPYLSEVVIEKIYYTQAIEGLIWYHTIILSIMVFNAGGCYLGYNAIEILYPTQTIQLIREWGHHLAVLIHV
jgi:hypothetical protein